MSMIFVKEVSTMNEQEQQLLGKWEAVDAEFNLGIRPPRLVFNPGELENF
jgi:hypothetical protein